MSRLHTLYRVPKNGTNSSGMGMGNSNSMNSNTNDNNGGSEDKEQYQHPNTNSSSMGSMGPMGTVMDNDMLSMPPPLPFPPSLSFVGSFSSGSSSVVPHSPLSKRKRPGPIHTQQLSSSSSSTLSSTPPTITTMTSINDDIDPLRPLSFAFAQSSQTASSAVMIGSSGAPLLQSNITATSISMPLHAVSLATAAVVSSPPSLALSMPMSSQVAPPLSPRTPPASSRSNRNSLGSGGAARSGHGSGIMMHPNTPPSWRGTPQQQHNNSFISPNSSPARRSVIPSPNALVHPFCPLHCLALPFVGSYDVCCRQNPDYARRLSMSPHRSANGGVSMIRGSATPIFAARLPHDPVPGLHVFNNDDDIASNSSGSNSNIGIDIPSTVEEHKSIHSPPRLLTRSPSSSSAQSRASPLRTSPSRRELFASPSLSTTSLSIPNNTISSIGSHADRFIPSRSASHLSDTSYDMSELENIAPQHHQSPHSSPMLVGRGNNSSIDSLDLSSSSSSLLSSTTSSPSRPLQYRVPLRGTVASPYTSSTLNTSPASLTSVAASRRQAAERRSIATRPYRTLDAPGLRDDFYLNLVDWSSTNVLAVGLDNIVYLWTNGGKVTELVKLTSPDYVTSVAWTLHVTRLLNAHTIRH
jgi:hypothetical protein